MAVSLNGGFSPQTIPFLIGVSMIFTIHFGGNTPYFFGSTNTNFNQPSVNFILKTFQPTSNPPSTHPPLPNRLVVFSTARMQWAHLGNNIQDHPRPLVNSVWTRMWHLAPGVVWWWFGVRGVPFLEKHPVDWKWFPWSWSGCWRWCECIHAWSCRMFWCNHHLLHEHLLSLMEICHDRK